MGFKIKLKAPKIKLDSKSLGNWVKNATGQFNPLMKTPKGPGDPGESPELTALRAKLQGEAQRFRQDLPGLEGDAAQGITKQANQAIESGVKGTRKNYNDRGLLYSGMRERGEGDVRARVASEMANQRSASSRELQDLASKKEMVAATVGMESYRDAVNRESEIAAQNMANSVARGQAMQQLGRAGGDVAGYYGNRNSSVSTAPSTYSGTSMAGQSNLNTSAIGKTGGGFAPTDQLGDKNAPGASKSYVAPPPAATTSTPQMPGPLLGAGAQANTGGMGDAIRRMRLSLSKGPGL